MGEKAQTHVGRGARVGMNPHRWEWTHVGERAWVGMGPCGQGSTGRNGPMWAAGEDGWEWAWSMEHGPVWLREHSWHTFNVSISLEDPLCGVGGGGNKMIYKY